MYFHTKIWVVWYREVQGGYYKGRCKEEIVGRKETLCFRRIKDIGLLKGSQDLPACLSGKVIRKYRR
jgi:hypothetical protein